jgi:GntR family transcriptional regulator
MSWRGFLTRLARRGLLRRQRGVGTFVAGAAIEQPLTGLYSFLRTLTSQGHLPGTRLLGHRLTVDAQASLLLTGRPEGLVVELSRLRLVDGEPFVVETIYLPEHCGQALPYDELDQAAVYELLTRVCGITVTRAEETLQPVTLDQPEAALLGLSVGEPAFLVQRTGFAAEQAVELRISLIRGDRYRFRVLLEGPALSGGRHA